LIGKTTGGIAEALELPGVMTYGSTREEAISNTERLAIEVIADRIKRGELLDSTMSRSYISHRDLRKGRLNGRPYVISI
jgi:predicted RNase H-like HicB family nuclease